MFDKRFWNIIVIFFLIVAITFTFPFLFTQKSWVNFNFKGSGEIGDTIGGILGPFIAIIAALLTFLAFWVQYYANKQQKEDLEIERFENKFYNLIQIHRNNVTEIGVGKSLKGRKTFISMFNELKYTYLSTQDFYQSRKDSNDFPDINSDQLFNISYLVFFFGIGPNSTKIIKDLVDPTFNSFCDSLEVYLKGCQKNWVLERRKGLPIAVNERDTVFTLNIKYKPCNGHMSKLSHYIRHLYQLVKFVDDSKIKSFDYDSKYEYVSTIRSQLSPHEQLLLYYNALSVLGKPWMINNNLIKKYCVIKSLPLPLADFYKEPLTVFGEENDQKKVMFEWVDIKTRLENSNSEKDRPLD